MSNPNYRKLEWLYLKNGWQYLDGEWVDVAGRGFAQESLDRATELFGGDSETEATR